MKIKNNYNEKIYWRAFKSDDTAYIIGLNQGSVNPNGIDNWVDDSFAKIKVEVKTGDIVFSDKVLTRAGTIFNMSDDLVVDKDGNLSKAKVQFDGNTKERKIIKSDIQFIDLRNFNKQDERTLTSRLENAFSSTEGFEQSHSHGQTWTVGGELGGTIGEEDVASGNAKLSVEFQDQVVDSLTNSYQRQITSTWERTWTDTLRFAPKKLHVIKIEWTVTLITGNASYLGETTQYSVIKSANPSLLQPSSYDSVDMMPKEYQEAFLALQSQGGKRGA